MSHTKRDILFALLLVLVMIGLLVWYLLARPKAAFPVGTLATTTPTSTNVASNTASVVEHVTDSGQYYEADLEYPSATPLAQTAGAAADAAVVATMKNYAENAIATFKQDTDVADITPQIAEDQGLNAYNKYQLTSTYQLYTSPSTVSYVFAISENTLGANPNLSFKTFTFNAKTGANLQLSELFTSSADYLNTLSTLTRSALATQQGADADPTFIDPGTTATAANFQNFALDGSDLIIFFAPYAVAPYSLGPQTVRIPLSQLSSVLNPSY